MKKIFIVEDNPVYLMFLTKSLEKEYEVHGFTDPVECMLTFKNSKPDVLILDYHLPNITGVELFEKINGDCPYDGRIVIISAMEDTKLLLDFIKKGGRDYVVKDEKIIECLIPLIENNEDEYLNLITKE